MRLISDIHGDWRWYISITSGIESSIQLGDFGFGFFQQLQSVVDDSLSDRMPNHRFIRGNHDDPELCRLSPNYLGDYGIVETDRAKVFFVSGANSIDREYRTEGVSWWREEELSRSQMDKALELYTREKPDYVVSHECPMFVVTQIHPASQIRPSCTQYFLESLYNTHAPKGWWFGHHHRNIKVRTDTTTFACIQDGDYVDVPELGNFKV